MKARIILVAAFAALALLGTGCKKHQWRPEPGTPITFRAVSAPAAEGESTKTVYSGQYYTLYSTPFEHIDWVEGDDMTIGYVYFNEGEELHGLSHGYIVSGVSSPDRSSYPGARTQASLTPAGGNGLVWQDADNHGFYACYPDLTQVDGFVFNIENGIVNYRLPLRFPAEQYPVTSDETSTLNLLDGTQISCVRFAPDMRYAYMCGDNMESGFVPAGGSVNLLFDSPEFTFYEFSADSQDADELVVNYFTLTDSENPLAGEFELIMDPLSGHDHRNAVEDSGLSNSVKFYFHADKSPVTIAKGTPIVFGVFVGHDEHMANTHLTISFNIVKGGVAVNRSLKLQSKSGDAYNWIYFNQRWKNRIYGLTIPLDITGEWFENTSAGGYQEEDWEL